MRTTRGLERLVTFVDAIVAIAITLLILPVVDLVGAERGHRSTELFSVPLGQLGVFLLSFAVIARLWTAHHAIFEHVHRYDAALMSWTLAWALTIVFLPFPTELAVDTSGSHVSVRALYIGTMAMSSVCLAALAILISRRPELRTPELPAARSTLSEQLPPAGQPTPADQPTPVVQPVATAPPRPFSADLAVISAAMFVVAFVLAVSVRPIGYYALLLLIPSGWVVKLWRRHRRLTGPTPTSPA